MKTGSSINERDEQDKKLGPQTLPAIFWGLEAEARKSDCGKDLRTGTGEVYIPEGW